jgi:starch synthase (maltosyl-transferring)
MKDPRDRRTTPSRGRAARAIEAAAAADTAAGAPAPAPATPTAPRARPAGRGARNAASFPAVIVAGVTPSVEGGRYAAKRVVGDVVRVGADVFKDGHDQLRARVRYRGPADEAWRTAPLAYDAAEDRWEGEFAVDAVGAWRFTVEAWTDTFGTWRGGLAKKVAAGQDVAVELLEGRAWSRRPASARASARGARSSRGTRGRCSTPASRRWTRASGPGSRRSSRP